MQLTATQYFEKSIWFSKTMLYHIGFWPASLVGAKKTKIDRLLTFIRYFLFGVSVFSTIGEVIMLSEKTDLLSFADCLSTITPLMISLAIQITIVIKAKPMVQLLEDILEYSKSKSDYRSKSYGAIYENIKLSMIVLLGTISVAGSIYVATPAIITYYGNHGKPLPFNSWFPFDTSTSPAYQIAFLIDAIRGIILVNVISGSDCIFIVLISFIGGEFEILQLSIRNIYKTARANLGGSLVQAALEKEMTRLLKGYIKQHKRLIRSCDILEDIYSNLIFVHILLHSVSICAPAFQLLWSMESSDYYLFPKYGVYLLATTFEFYVYGHYGSHIVEQSGKISEASFYSDWNLIKSTKYRKLILRMMERSQKPCCLTAAKFTILSVETFKEIMNRAASYLTLLRTFKDKSP